MFVHCNPVKNLWQEVAAWLSSLDVSLSLNKKILIFGQPTQPSDSVSNYVILHVKYFIWISKQKEQIINVTAFKKYLYHKLFELKNVYLYQDRMLKFNQWNDIFNDLLLCQ